MITGGLGLHRLDAGAAARRARRRGAAGRQHDPGIRRQSRQHRRYPRPGAGQHRRYPRRGTDAAPARRAGLSLQPRGADQPSRFDARRRRRSRDQLPARSCSCSKPAARSRPRSAIVHRQRRGRSTAGRDYLPVDETHPLRPVDVNGVNKMAGEAYHLLYHDVYGIDSRVAAPDQHLRPAHADQGCAPDFRRHLAARGVIEGKPFEVWGGEQRRDLHLCRRRRRRFPRSPR